MKRYGSQPQLHGRRVAVDKTPSMRLPCSSHPTVPTMRPDDDAVDSLSVLCIGPFGPVVRLRQRKKEPAGRSWQTTNDNHEARRWVTAGANVAIATGHRVTVLDVDGIIGRRTLDRLEADHGQLPDCPIVATPRKGRHLYFAAVEGLASSASLVGPGLDIRGTGGYAVAPPSRGVGYSADEPNASNVRRYEWLRLGTPPTMPPWLVDLASRPESAVSLRESFRSAGAGLIDRACREIAAAPLGSRYVTERRVINRVLRRLVERNQTLTDGDATRLVEASTRAPDEVRRVIDSATKFVTQQ